MAIINGIKGAYLQPVEYGEDSSGPYTIVRAQGTRNEIKQLIAQLRQQHAQWSIKEGYSGAADVLEARIPAPAISITEPEIPVNDWELFNQGAEKDILEADVSIINSLTANEKDGLSQYMSDPGPDTTPARTPGSDYDRLFDQIQAGLRSVEIVAPVLRHTQTVSANWTVKAALTNVGRLLSTATLESSEGVPVDVLFELPSGTTTRPDMAYAWKKEFPTVRVSANNKRQIEQEFKYGLWSTLLYQAVL